MKRIFIIASMCMLVAGLSAQQRVPAYRGMIERVQPNGDTLRVYLHGDERSHFTVTEDGWLILENDKGWLKYAKRTRKGEVVISRRKAHNAKDRKKCETKWINKYGIKKD